MSHAPLATAVDAHAAGRSSTYSSLIQQDQERSDRGPEDQRAADQEFRLLEYGRLGRHQHGITTGRQKPKRAAAL